MRSGKQKKLRFKDMIAYEKKRMLPLNFAMAYRITPAYVVLAILLIAAFGSLMQADDQQNLPMGLACLGVLALLTVALLASVPFVRKKAIRTELQRYDLDTVATDAKLLDSKEAWDFSDEALNAGSFLPLTDADIAPEEAEKVSVRFDRFGLWVGYEDRERVYYYNHLHKRVVTDNECQRVLIYLAFAVSSEQYLLLPVTAATMKMLEDFHVVLENQEVLDYIFAHPQEAFADIYSKGRVTVKE